MFSGSQNQLTITSWLSDLIAVVGDLVDGSIEQLRNVAEPLKNLQAKFGIYFTTGKLPKST